LDEEGGEEKDLSALSNHEFFLNYTKQEYIAFASRTDVVAPCPPPQQSDSEEEEEDDDEDEDGEEEEGNEDSDDDAFEPGEDTKLGVAEKNGLLNVIMNEVLRKYRVDHGRGP